MKRFSLFCILALLFAAQIACNFPLIVQPTATSSGPGAAPLPSPTSAPASTPLPESTSTTPPEPTSTTAPATEAPTATPVSFEALKNFSYWIEDFKIQAPLQDGAFDDPQAHIQLDEKFGSGDLNGDGQPDAAVILIVDPSGSGTFYYLFALRSENGSLVQAAQVYIGDRQGIRNLEIADGQIRLDYVTQGPNDPLCCASQHRLRNYRLEEGTLRIESEQDLGSIQ